METIELASALRAIAMANIAQRRRARRRDALETLALAGAAFTCSTVAVALAVALWLLINGRI
jgi:hypothetical protein